jgi:hypothetical protein
MRMVRPRNAEEIGIASRERLSLFCHFATGVKQRALARARGYCVGDVIRFTASMEIA